MTTPQGAVKARPGQQAPAPVPAQPFRVGVYDQESGADYDQTVTMTTSTVTFPAYSITPNGWLKGLWFLIECTTAGNSAATAFKADAPFSAIKQVTFYDVGGKQIFGPITGYDWLTIMKFGGYHEIGDPRADLSYSTTTGAGATGGSFTMVMYLPLELVERDALGSIENKSTSAAYRVELILDQSSNVYSTAPTTLGTVRCRVILDGYTEPQAATADGRPASQAPPAAGTIQYWSTENGTLPVGSTKYLVQTGLGYSIRNIVFKLVDSTGSRAQGDADWPDPVLFQLGQVQLFNRFKKLWISKMGKDFGLTSTTADSALGRENGVFPVWFNQDFGLRVGAELRNDYLVTKPGNVLALSGSIGGSGTHTLYATVNYVVPPGNDPAQLRAMR